MYDASGHKWNYEFVAEGFKNTWVSRFLAHTFYNPSFTITLKWISKGPYAIDELKQKIKECIDADDDIITQFVEGKSIELSVVRASSFAEIVQVLDKLVFHVDTEDLWNTPDKVLLTDHVIDILRTVKARITDDSDLLWTHFKSAAEMREEMDGLMLQLEHNDAAAVESVRNLFLPTASFQEHAMSNGWTKEYMKLAEQFDELYAELKK